MSDTKLEYFAGRPVKDHVYDAVRSYIEQLEAEVEALRNAIKKGGLQNDDERRVSSIS